MTARDRTVRRRFVMKRSGTASRKQTAKGLRKSKAVPREARSELERKVAQRTRELTRANERYALAMEASGSGFWDWIIGTDEYYVSPRLLEMCGLPAETRYKGRADIVDLMPFRPEDKLAWTESVSTLFAVDSPSDRYERELQWTQNGETHWIHLTGVVLRDALGAPERWSGSAMDITRRKRVEVELARQQAYHDELFELAPDALILTTINNPVRTLRINREFTRMFGYTSQEAVGRRMRELIAPDEVRPANLTQNEDLLAGRRVETEAIRQRKDGTRFHAHITAQRVRLRDEDAAFVIYRDVTERMRIEAELRSRQEMLDLAQKAARAVAFDWHIGVMSGGNRWSPELEALFDVTPGNYDGSFKGWANLVYAQDWPSVRDAIERGSETGDVIAEYRVVHARGTARWLQMRGRMLLDVGGKPERLIGFMIDVTDRRAAEDELRRMEVRLRQAQRLEAIGTLAGGIAHDFNNILGAILGYGEMALRGMAKGSRVRRDLDSIMSAGERGRALVDRILAFSSSSVGERVKVHVEGVVNEVIDMVMPALPENVNIEVQLNAGRAATLGDPTQLHQVVMNLAANAVQAMPSGGTLRVSLECVTIDTLHSMTTGTVKSGHYLVLQIADNGVGMSPAIMERIFNPFFTTKEVGSGTGLGLSLVHGIVTGMDGAIDVASTIGTGSMFTVYLPRAGDAAHDDKTETPNVPHGSGQRVLLVDDEEPLVRLATETLEELGYTPLGFTSSADALAAFRANPTQFDAVITDERMPGMSGTELIREVRAIRSAIPILLVSGYVGGMVAERAYNVGANAVVKKPLSARDLAASLARVLPS